MEKYSKSRIIMTLNLRNIANSSLILLSFGGLFFFLNFPVQSLSPFILIAGAIYLLIPKGINKNDIITKYLIILLIYIITITFFNIIIELFNDANIYNRIGYLIRQSISIAVGVIQYYIFRYILIKENLNKNKNNIRNIIILNLILAIIDRVVFKNSRSQGLFSEPSHLAEFYAFYCLPNLYIYEKSKNKLIIYSLISFIAISLTLSFTGIIRALLFYFGILLFSKSRKLKIYILIFLIIFAIIFFIYINSSKNSYLSYMVILAINVILNGGEFSRSITDRVAFIDIIKNVIIHKNIFGLGLGAEAYENLIVSEKMLSIIKTEKHWGMSIVSMPGKIVVYGGLFGLIAFLLIYFKIFKICKKIPNNIIVSAILFAMFCYMFIGLSSFALPYLWYWFAYVSIAYVKGKKHAK